MRFKDLNQRHLIPLNFNRLHQTRRPALGAEGSGVRIPPPRPLINSLELNRFSRIRFEFSKFQFFHTILWRPWNLCCGAHSTRNRYQWYHPICQLAVANRGAAQ
jgi:hypothetical protein